MSASTSTPPTSAQDHEKSHSSLLLPQTDLTEARNEPTEAEKAAERKLVRKLDKRIMPIACLLYLFACKSPCRPAVVHINILSI